MMLLNAFSSVSVAHMSEELKLAIIQTLRTLVKNSEYG